ncbi:5'-deoxynucleotidase HDDC2 [Cotesia typhae]|uniref:5'-deoxynucleotidase HDDC2 n=1 Tax=Cotesia typhae TaxID=2053667 RepID=UPI003D69B035
MNFMKLQEFMELVGQLKHIKRTGWVLRNIEGSETIAAHMYRMAVLSLLVDTQENLDKNKIMQMALVHDLAECIVGDITPHCGISPEEKHRLEDDAMMKICQLLGNQGSNILEIFREYESQQSNEAKYVKDLDRLDLISQAYEYEKRDGTPGKLEEFFANTVDKISHPFLKKMAAEITSQRQKIIGNK